MEGWTGWKSWTSWTSWKENIPLPPKQLCLAINVNYLSVRIHVS